MKRRIFLTSRLIAFSLIALLSMAMGTMRADETITVTATSSDISENLDLKTLATLFGQEKILSNLNNCSIILILLSLTLTLMVMEKWITYAL